MLAYVMGPDVYLPPSIAWPTMRLHLREFIVKLASLPVWLSCGLWAFSLLRRGGEVRRVAASPSRLFEAPGVAVTAER